MNSIHKVSVREMIEFILRSGSIMPVSLSSSRMQDGTKAHTKYQTRMEKEMNYVREVSVKKELEYRGITYVVSGRIDGVIDDPMVSDDIILDEIKSTGGSILDYTVANPMHLAQVHMYAYMFMCQHDIKKLRCRVTYIELETFETRIFEEEKCREEVEAFFYDTVKKYAEFVAFIAGFEKEAKESLKALEFPFTEHREGQAYLMKGVYKAILAKKELFARAPTGIGKTVATLFPALKAYSHDHIEKVFFLTAKTIGKEVALHTIDKMVEQGAKLKYVAITAKDKICFKEETKCNPEYCEYAKGHYDRVNDAIMEMLLDFDCYDRDHIEGVAKKHKVCPYEFSLDLALFSQVIICDYNYVFDPSAMLKRFFADGDPKKYTLLVDEAHNLVDRSRSMYSASLSKMKILEVKRLVGKKDDKVKKYLQGMNEYLLDKRKEMEEREVIELVEENPPLRMETYLRGVIHQTEKIFKTHKDHPEMEKLLAFYFEVYDFLKKYEMYSKHYCTYYEKDGNEVYIKLFCIDPRENIVEIIRELSGVIFFSATLLPMDYYQHILGGSEESFGLNLPSPFDENKMKLLINQQISTKYMDRERTIREVCEQILTLVSGKKGNYLVYFPSYQYMHLGVDTFTELLYEHKRENEMKLLLQKPMLTEEEKEVFISSFSEEKEEEYLVGFAVLGGMFSEGIDLVGDKLVGAVVVSVSLPLLCLERNIIKEHFSKEDRRKGFDYAYTYPGMNKVLQSAGRVIRTKEDKGAVLLIDQRFRSRTYENMYPGEWSHREYYRKTEELQQKIKDFWRQE